MRTRIIGILSTEDRIFLVATLEILEEIFNKEWPGPEMLWIHGAHGGHGFFIHGGHSKQSSEFKRIFFWILRKI